MAVHQAVFGACMEDIGAALEPTADAAWIVHQHVNHLGWDASTLDPMTWAEWVDELVHRFDATWTSWAKDVDELVELWPLPAIESLLDTHHRWRERYDRLIGCYRRAGEIEDLTILSPAEHADAVAYRASMDRLWDATWWWRGWLGRYISGRVKAEGP